MSKENNLVAVDFETYYDTEYSLRNMSVRNYLHDSRFNAYLVAVYDGEGINYTGHPGGFDWSRLDGMTLCAHNASFDEQVYRRLVELKVIKAPVKDCTWLCTADLAAWLGVKRDLASASRFLLGETLSKAVREAMKGRTAAECLSDPDVVAYGNRDAITCYRLAERHLKDWPERERRVSRLNREAGYRGMALDIQLVYDGLKILNPKLEEAEGKLPWVAQGEKPLSPNAAKSYAASLGIPVPASFAKDSEDFQNWLEEYGKRYEWAKAMGDYRSLNTLIGRIQSLRDGRDPQTNRFPYGVKYMGAACLTGDHEVLTRAGWVRLDCWKGGEIMQWTPGGTMDFLPAKQNILPNNDTSMVCVDAPFYKARMTLGHTVPIYRHGAKRFDTVKAAELLIRKAGVYIPVSGISSHTGTLTPEQMRVLVAVQADGSYEAREHGRVCLNFAMRKPRKLKRIQELLTAASVKFYGPNKYPSSKNSRITVRGDDIPAWLGRDKKFFGAWLLDSSADARLAFVEELVHWDGCLLGKSDPATRYAANVEYGSIVRGNVEWVATMAHLSGLSVGKISAREPRGNRKVFYRIVLRRKTVAMPGVVNMYSVPSVPVVYCPTATTGFFMYRYLGVIGITGNTGRFSGGGEGGGKVNVHNMPRKPMYGVDVRPMFCAARGHKLLVSDYNQIEARYLLWRVGNEAALAPMRLGKSVYQAYAESCGLCDPGSDIKHEKADLYQYVKACVLGAGYGCGGAKFQKVAKMMAGLELTEAESFAAVEDFRNRNPQIVRFWREHHDALAYSARCKDETHQVELKSGRVLTYWEPRIVDREIEVYQTRGEYKTRMYGGKLTENEVQASCRDILCDAWLACADAGLLPVLNVHDELVFEVPESSVPENVEKVRYLMTTCSPWAEGLPLGVDINVLDAYAK